MDIELVRRAIQSNNFRVTDHADEEMAADRLLLDEVLASISTGEVIEDYPGDHPLPSCLNLSRTEAEAAIHSVWGYNGSTGRAVLITVYRPDPARWIDLRVRKPAP